MGYRAHIYKKKIVEYSDNEYFNWQCSELNEYINQLKEDMLDYAEDNNIESMIDVCTCDPFDTEDEYGGVLGEWEIYREWLEQAVLYLDVQIIKGKGDDIAFGDGDNAYTLEYVRNAFDSWLKESSNKDNFTYPEFVYISWF